MTEVQLYLAIGVPIIAILASLTLSLIQISGIRDYMRAFRTEIREDGRTLRAEIRQDMQGLRADLTMLTGKVIEIDNRLTRIEERLNTNRPGGKTGIGRPLAEWVGLDKMSTAIILFAHGSRIESANDAVRKVAADLARRWISHGRSLVSRTRQTRSCLRCRRRRIHRRATCHCHTLLFDARHPPGTRLTATDRWNCAYPPRSGYSRHAAARRAPRARGSLSDRARH